MPGEIFGDFGGVRLGDFDNGLFFRTWSRSWKSFAINISSFSSDELSSISVPVELIGDGSGNSSGLSSAGLGLAMESIDIVVASD
jgi:hypothetical protein